MTNQEAFAWVQEFPGAVTVCDRDGIILAMNNKSARTFENDGGAALIGSSLFGCHPEPARTKLMIEYNQLLTAGMNEVQA
jgi:hypothetical protein